MSKLLERLIIAIIFTIIIGLLTKFIGKEINTVSWIGGLIVGTVNCILISEED